MINIIFLAAAAFLTLIGVFLYYQNNKIDITDYDINADSIKDEIKIIHLSDLHSKPFHKVMDIVQAKKPDLILITGDYINDRCKNKEKMIAFGKALVNIAPVYYITGNHERRLEQFEGLMEELKAIGFHVLLNELACTTVKNSTINILGLDENQADFDDYKARKNGTFKYKDMSPYFRQLKNANGFKIVLSHFPENFEMVKENNYAQYDFDLQFSGHAHGGQFILPFIGPLFSPGQGILPKYARGSFGTRPKLIVSRGLGNAEFPFRLFNHPEIIIVQLKNSTKS